MDYFELLEENRRPWLDPVALRQKFFVLSAPIHPDKIHSADEAQKNAAAKKFADLNAAYTCLAEPKSRLLHLLELETGTKPKEIQQIPDGLANLFAEVAVLCKQVDSFLPEKTQNSSPLLAIQFFERAQEWIGQLEALKNKLGVLRGELDDGLRSLDAAWVNSDATGRQKILTDLEKLYRLFGYFNRWNNQIQERIVQLTL